MKKKQKLGLLCLTTAAVFSTITSVYAWGGWGGLINPGDEVFDAKRFDDSVEETAKMLLTAQNTLKSLTNRLKFNEGVTLNIPLQSAAQNGSTMVNPKNDYKNTPFWKSWSVHEALEDRSYENKIDAERAQSGTEAAAVLQEVANNQIKREEAIQDILNLASDGILSEKQKANAIEIIDCMTTIDQAKMTGTAYMNAVSDQEATAAIDRLDREKIKAGNVYGYDPYHPSKFDTNHKKNTSVNFGFLPFGQ